MATRIKLFLSITTLIGAVFLFSGCSTGSTNGVPDMVGWIDSVQESQGEIPGRIHVNSPDNNTSDRFIVTVTDETEILELVDGEQKRARFDSFMTGQKVEIWFSGPVMESYPAQVSADRIVITEEPSSAVMPPLDTGAEGILLKVSCEEFMETPHITREVELTFPGSLVVSLCANPTTGFQWEEVKIGDESVIHQTEHNYVSPEVTGVVGSSGKDVWSFNSSSRGTSTLIFEYSRPWEGGEKDEWTLGLTVVVK